MGTGSTVQKQFKIIAINNSGFSFSSTFNRRLNLWYFTTTEDSCFQSGVGISYYKYSLKLDKNIWNNHFQDIGHEATKDGDPWDMGIKGVKPTILNHTARREFSGTHVGIGSMEAEEQKVWEAEVAEVCRAEYPRRKNCKDISEGWPQISIWGQISICERKWPTTEERSTPQELERTILGVHSEWGRVHHLLGTGVASVVGKS